MEVELRESPDSVKLFLSNNTPPNAAEEGAKIIVRAEEILLVVLVLIIWVAAIILFFNRWGKIRMLEPYQPKFQQNHRLSCPLAPLTSPVISTQQRMSFSKYNVSCFNDNIYSTVASPNPARRPRQNSVFVSSPTLAFLNPPRRAKSAMDIQHLVLNEKPQALTTYSSMLPMLSTSLPINKERKPSITVDRINVSGTRCRPLYTSAERPLLSRYYYTKNRRMSCFTEKLPRQRHFMSFDHPQSTDRKTSITIEKPSISFESPQESFENPSVIVESVCVSSNRSLASIKETTASSPARETATTPFTCKAFSRSLDTHSTSEKHKPKRMAVSLDVHTAESDCQEMKTFSEQGGKSHMITMDSDEIKLTAPFFENLESSDV
ncbi:uncharacterized protein LOC108734194 isoform X3 [Agrilus planipennis]|nr:uncharacterized protein LOC108734194 isoform X3 [Agrilus planipennis]